MRIFFVSTFVGTFLPASIGGDAVRAYSLAKLNVARRRRGGVGLHGSHARRRVDSGDGGRRSGARARPGRQRDDRGGARRGRRACAA